MLALVPHAQRPKPSRRAPRVVIQPRDVALFELLATFRIATLPDLYPHLREHFPRPLLLWRRAAVLTGAHYLVRPPEQHLRLFKKRGNPPHIYALGTKAAELLRARGWDLPRVDFDQKAKAWRAHTLDHRLAATHVLSMLLLGAAERGNFETLAVFPDGDFTDTTVFYEDGAAVELPIRPDATLALHDQTTDERLALFVEIDQGTEPLTRRTLSQSSYRKKVLAYLSYFHESDRFAPILNARTFAVLNVTDTPARAEALRTVAARATDDPDALNLFWFATTSSFSLDAPAASLSAPIWTTAAGTEGALF